MANAIGIDTSYWDEGLIDWAGAQKAGICFGIARAANGIAFDKTYAVDIPHMKSAGVIAGDYLEFNILADPIQQANVYFNTAGKDKNPLSPWIAFENANLPAGNWGPTTLADKSLACLKEVERLWGKPAGIYTGFYDWRDLWGGPAWSKGKALWIARYSTQPPMIPLPFETWQFWQFTGTYTWPGGHADGNYFNGTPDELRKLLGITTASIEDVVRALVAFARPKGYTGPGLG